MQAQSKFQETLQRLADIAGIAIHNIEAPSDRAAGMCRTSTAEDAQKFAGMIDLSGIEASAVSRRGYHMVFIG